MLEAYVGKEISLCSRNKKSQHNSEGLNNMELAA